MAFDLNSFFTNISQYGFTNPSKFDVSITPPKFFSDRHGFDYIPSILQFRAESVIAPSVMLISNETHPYGAGPIIKQPNAAAQGDIHITFIADKDAIIYSYFYNWMNYIYNFSDLYNDAGVNSFNNSIPNKYYNPANYMTGFEDNYISPVITINYYDNTGVNYQKINAYNAKPTLLTSSHLNWETTNQAFKIKVVLAYKEWSLAIPNLTEKQSSQNIQRSILTNPNR